MSFGTRSAPTQPTPAVTPAPPPPSRSDAEIQAQTEAEKVRRRRGRGATFLDDTPTSEGYQTKGKKLLGE